MTELVPSDEFDQRILEDARELADAGDEEAIMVPLLLLKPELDTIIRVLRKTIQRDKHPETRRWAAGILDQAVALNAQYERVIHPDYEEDDE